MARNRVRSFISNWGSGSREPSPPAQPVPRSTADNGRTVAPIDTRAGQSAYNVDNITSHSPPPRSPATPSRARADSRVGSRPLSMIQTWQPPQVEVAGDTPPELQPIFSYLNSHSNKLYQEGYFLKLHDLDSRGRPSNDRKWVECFAQLVGTVLSLWDAAALDIAGVDGEVVPTFINLSDASLKMIESLPMSGAQGGKLQNVLSISTAANNRYLLHFNSLASLTQWTAGIRLAMFEHATLQEAYTGSLIAGKGRSLNNIKLIMDRARFPTEDWARVRFGAGTPWRRLWFVISPPDEKEFQKAQKMLKKGASYLRSQLPRGDIKFYESRKVTKKTKPIATINDVYAAYAIYPQSKPLIEQSTLVKMEGLVTVHGSPETSSEGFVFIMPEVHPAVSGFEMMLRWLFPVWDTFNLYGRPARLIAEPLDQRGLMFAMPRDRRYGYLDTLDVSGLIHENGSQTWSERQWRKQMKKLTAERMSAQLEHGPVYQHRRSGTGSQASLPNARQGVRFNDGDSVHSSQSRSASPAPVQTSIVIPKHADASQGGQRGSPHKRAASEVQNYKRYQTETPSRLSQEMGREENYAPVPPRHGQLPTPSAGPGSLQRIESGVATPTLASVKAGFHPTTDPAEVPPAPVTTPPAFTHNPSSTPAIRPAAPVELRRAHSAVDDATMAQMRDAVRPAGADEEYGNLAANMVATSHSPDQGSNTDRSQGAYAILNQAQLSSMMALATTSEQDSSHSTSQSSISKTPSTQPDRPTLPPSRSSMSIARKPVARQPVEAALPRATTPTPEHEVFADEYIDNDALERILQDDARLNSMTSAASSATPDYASTRSGSSRHAKEPVERPRMGQLKTVGDPDMVAQLYRTTLDPKYEQLTIESELPAIDFGPTYAMKPEPHPDAGKLIAYASRARSKSRDRLSTYMAQPGRASPGGLNDRADSPADLDQPGNRSSMVWVPGRAASPGPAVGLTPEQWVQHRAAIASQPMAPPGGHSRQSSTSTITRKLTKTPPPFGRSGSGDWSQLDRTSSSRPGSRGATTALGQPTPPIRPGSRGASTYFGQPSPGGTIPQSQLSAREQMYVARATGTPLLTMPTSSRSRENVQPNLIDAVEQRQREKAAIKEGMRNSMVEEAIRSRQQQLYQQQAEAMRQATLRAQQQSQHAAVAQQFQQNAMPANSAQSLYHMPVTPGAGSPSLYQAQRQSWLQPQPQQGYAPNYYYETPQAPQSPRLYEGPQHQAFMAQQGQPHMPRYPSSQGYGGQ